MTSSAPTFPFASWLLFVLHDRVRRGGHGRLANAGGSLRGGPGKLNHPAANSPALLAARLIVVSI